MDTVGNVGTQCIKVTIGIGTQYQAGPIIVSQVK